VRVKIKVTRISEQIFADPWLFPDNQKRFDYGKNKGFDWVITFIRLAASWEGKVELLLKSEKAFPITTQTYYPLFQ
jgi:hypothetical protein